MSANELERYREIIPDKPGTKLPSISWDDKQTLNCQSGFNRPLLEQSDMCGCFHCGRRFPAHLVASWLREPGEEDTGICPYCGEDTLIVGTAEFPLTTALLSMLYEEWFKEERDKREAAATIIPSFAGYDGYFSQGVPFRWEESAGRRLLREIGIWSIGNPGEGRYDCEGAPEPGVYTDVPLGGVWSLRAWEEEVDDGLTEDEIDALDDEEFWSRVDVVEHYVLERDGVTVRFTPWSGEEQQGLINLYAEYGDRLIASFKDCGFSKMQIYADESKHI